MLELHGHRHQVGETPVEQPDARRPDALREVASRRKLLSDGTCRRPCLLLLSWRLRLLLCRLWLLEGLPGSLPGREPSRRSTGVGLAMLLAPAGRLLLAHEWRFPR
jgi:hypothetical protein